MAMQSTSSVTVDNLFATTTTPVLTDVLTVAQGQTLKRGALLTAAGALCDASAEVYAVLADDVDTTDGAKEAAVYLKGEFNENALSVAEGATVADLKQSARKVDIYFKSSM